MSRLLLPLRTFALAIAVMGLLHASAALALANRVFASARSGNNANSCDNINTPCQTLQAAISQLNPGGEAIVLDSGGYGALSISHGVTIEAAPGVTAFIHPPSGDAITICAPSETVTLRGLTLSVGGVGIKVNCVGTLNVENVSISGFTTAGIFTIAAGRLNVKGTDITDSDFGILISISAGSLHTSIDHCHLDGNGTGFSAGANIAGTSTTTEATYTTANNNTFIGWASGSFTNGKDFLNLEFCTGSENGDDGLNGASPNALSVVSYSNCVFANNGGFGVDRLNVGTFATRGNNTIIGNGLGPTNGTIGSFSPM